jgi:hypothetical protein
MGGSDEPPRDQVLCSESLQQVSIVTTAPAKTRALGPPMWANRAPSVCFYCSARSRRWLSLLRGSEPGSPRPPSGLEPATTASHQPRSTTTTLT